MSDGQEKSGGKTPRAARCPMCARPSDDEFRPFCSKRCANIDLSRWLTGSYVIPGGPLDSDGEDFELPQGPKDENDQ